jgi:hypothetical protein
MEEEEDELSSGLGLGFWRRRRRGACGERVEVTCFGIW